MGLPATLTEQVPIPIQYGSQGATIRAQPLNGAGGNVGSIITTGGVQSVYNSSWYEFTFEVRAGAVQNLYYAIVGDTSYEVYRGDYYEAIYLRTPAGIRDALGLASANVDTQLAALQSDTNDIQSRLPAELVSGRMDASVGAMAANTLTATAIATDAITASKLAADAIGASELSAAAVSKIVAGMTPGQTRLISTPLRSGRTEPVRYTRGATGPVLRDWLVDGTGSRIDLTGYTITASLLNFNTGSAVFSAAAASLGNAPDEGQVELDWPSGALATVGQYRLIWSAAGAETLTWTTLVVIE